VVVETKFSGIVDAALEQATAGLHSMAQAVVDTARESMPVHGRRRGDPGYASAPEGEPPYSHTETLAGSLDYGVDNGYFVVGPRSSEVGVRGAVLEFAARPGTKSGKRKYKRHPFLRPALDNNLDTFAPRVAGGFTG
jgi:hypothetical protein